MLSSKNTSKFRAEKLRRPKRENFIKIPLLKLVYAAIALNILNIAFILSIQKYLPPELPLFYGLAEGEEQLASPLQLTMPAIIALTITIMNTALASFLKNEFLQQALILTGLIVTAFSFITTLKISFLVGSF